MNTSFRTTYKLWDSIFFIGGVVPLPVQPPTKIIIQVGCHQVPWNLMWINEWPPFTRCTSKSFWTIYFSGSEDFLKLQQSYPNASLSSKIGGGLMSQGMVFCPFLSEKWKFATLAHRHHLPFEQYLTSIHGTANTKTKCYLREKATCSQAQVRLDKIF